MQSGLHACKASTLLTVISLASATTFCPSLFSHYFTKLVPHIHSHVLEPQNYAQWNRTHLESYDHGKKGYVGRAAALWGNGYLRVGRQKRGTEQLVGLLPVGLQHGLEPLQQLRPLLLQLLVAALQVTHSSLLPCQSEEKKRGAGEVAQLVTCLLQKPGGLS